MEDEKRVYYLTIAVEGPIFGEDDVIEQIRKILKEKNIKLVWIDNAR